MKKWFPLIALLLLVVFSVLYHMTRSFNKEPFTNHGILQGNLSFDNLITKSTFTNTYNNDVNGTKIPRYVTPIFPTDNGAIYNDIEDLGLDSTGSFCNYYGKDNNKLETACSSLTQNNCNTVNCCVYLNGKKCVAGDQSGPVFNGQATGNSWSYLNQMYGSSVSGSI